VRRADEHRADYMRRFYNVDWLDPRLYDLVISTDQIAPDVAVQMIVAAAMAVDKAAAGKSGAA
jgi:cytidylate kinase